MEYFKGNADLNPITPDEDGADAFAEAIRRRFSAPAILAAPFTTTSPTSPVAARASRSEPALLQITPHLTTGIAQQSNNILHPQLQTKLPPIPASFFTSTTPASLPALIADNATLLVDIRPPSQYDAKRISSSVPLSVPSTLLKRPLFTLNKLASMLPSKTAIEQFLKWSVSSRIIVVDTESSKLPEMSNVLGLLRKFRAERFAGELCWVQGGFAAISREAKCNRELAKIISSKPVSASDCVHSGKLARNLPHAAFEQSSTTIAGHRPTLSPAHSRQASQSEILTPQTHGAALGPSSRRVVAANPFYDNIRQLTELSQGITERIPIQIPQTVQDSISQLPVKWLRDLAGQSESESAEALAMQFYKVELAEQRRLMGIMDEHSRQSNDPTSRDDQHFPFSITAGIEEGEKNRYRNIWPYEHSRVHLQKPGITSSDYINASYVQPPGTDKRYIATQGPLPESYADFWKMVWDQNVPAIVMLTKRFEGSSVKCGTYWPVAQECGQTFGDVVVTLVSSPQEASEDDAIPPSYAESGGFNFGQTANHESQSCETTLARRTFTISSLREPDVAPREVAHFQYLDWPDHDVPASPQGLLDLIRDVEQITSAARAGPAVLHCSAGVGRTGAYILVDAVLDAVKKDLQSPGGELVQSTDAINSSQESVQEMDSPDESPRSRSPSESAVDVGESSSKPSSSPEVQLDGKPRRDSNGPWTASSSSLPRSASAEDLSGGSHLPRMQEVSRRLLTTSDSRPKVIRKRVTAMKKGRSIASLASPMVPMDWETTSPPPSRCESVASSMPAPIRQVQPNTALHPTGIHSDSSLSSGDASPFSKMESSSMTLATSIAPSRKNSPPSPPSPMANAFDFMQPRSTAVQSTQTHLMSLSMIDEPIRHILESMREQRMSLCQTLRQFVFAHRAIIEGSLAMMNDPQNRAQVCYLEASSAEKHAGREDDSSSSDLSIKRRRSLKRRQCSASVSSPRPVSRLKSDP